MKKLFKSLIKFLFNLFKTIYNFLISFLKGFWYVFQRVFLIGFLLFLAWWLSQEPSLYRDWSPDQDKLASITFNKNIVNIKNVRNFRYTSPTEYTPSYYSSSYNIDNIESVYYIIEPFSEYDWPAHTMLSFWFTWWVFLSVSAEIRKEKWESFDTVNWLLNQYEIVYIVWDENDLIKLRANYRKDSVYMYPIKASKEKIQALFLSVMHRAVKLSKEPEYYNTLWNTCATNILWHVNNLREEKIPWNKKILLPSRSDSIAYELWLIDTSLTLKEAREYYKINDLSMKFPADRWYSLNIRKDRK